MTNANDQTRRMSGNWVKCLKRGGCGVAAILALVVVTFPLWAKLLHIGGSHWCQFYYARDLRALYVAVEEYRETHEGKNPPTLSALDEAGLTPTYATTGPEPYVTTAGGQGCVYDPDASGDDPLIACYAVTRRPLTAVWITADGRIFVARMRMWPRYDESKRRTCYW